MPAVIRIQVDPHSGHPGGEPVVGSSGSSNVNVNGYQVMRQGDPYEPHGDNNHIGTVQSGSSTVFVNGKGIARAGDPVTCGATNANGSPNVNAG